MHHGLTGGRLVQRAIELLASVGISSPETRLRAFPHQLSAACVSAWSAPCHRRAAAPPDRRRADTSLDLTIQAQYLRLLKDLQARHRLAMIS